jgi:hypothetical protein
VVEAVEAVAVEAQQEIQQFKVWRRRQPHLPPVLVQLALLQGRPPGPLRQGLWHR